MQRNHESSSTGAKRIASPTTSKGCPSGAPRWGWLRGLLVNAAKLFPVRTLQYVLSAKAFATVLAAVLLLTLGHIATTFYYLDEASKTVSVRNAPSHGFASSDEAVFQRTADCRRYFEYHPVLAFESGVKQFEEASLEDIGHSYAFSHLLHKDVAIYETFLAMYFRPNNYYCVHVDLKSSQTVYRAVQNLVSCYSEKTGNSARMVVVPRKDSVNVTWGDWTVLQADLICLDLLLKMSQLNKEEPLKWRHSLSMAASELPNMPYSTFHRLLSSSIPEDQSALQSVPFLLSRDRYSQSQRTTCKSCPPAPGQPWVFELNNPLKPGGGRFLLSVFWGNRNVILSRDHVDFLLNHPVSREILKWFQQNLNTEEHFYATALRFTVQGDEVVQDTGNGTDWTRGICSRYALWRSEEAAAPSGCQGVFVNEVCNLVVMDLPKTRTNNTNCLMINKFNLALDPVAAILQYNRVAVLTEQVTGLYLSQRFYSNLHRLMDSFI